MSRAPRPTILLVEDSDDDAFFFQHALKKSGVDCSYVHLSDGGEAVRYLEAARLAPRDPQRPWPDLVFLDLKLPTLSGFEVLNCLQERQWAAQLDVAVLSGSEHASDVERARTLGASAYLVKPVAGEVIRVRVSTWAEKHARENGGAAAAQPAA